MNENYIKLTGITSTAEEIQQEKSQSQFLQSILEYSLAKGTAKARIKKFHKTGDGLSAWKELVEWYENQGSTETKAKNALQVITSHKLTSKSHGGAELYMPKFENALLDIEDAETPYCNVQSTKIELIRTN